MKRSRLWNIIGQFDHTHILVVGDMMLDRFIWGKVERISPEAPVPVVQVTRESTHLGGAANVVSNIRALGGRSTPVGMIGQDATAEDFCRLLHENGIEQTGLVTQKDFATIQKTRIIAHHQQVVRVDREGECGLGEAETDTLKQKLLPFLDQATALVISDYGKGVISKPLIEWLTRSFKGPICVDPKDKNFDYYHHVHILTPNQAEAERMSGIKIRDHASLRQAAALIFSSLSCRHLLITRGENGMALFYSPDHLIEIPTVAREVFDVSGAGDTVIATYALALGAGASPEEASILANQAAGVVVGKLGTATLTAEELHRAVGACTSLED